MSLFLRRFRGNKIKKYALKEGSKFPKDLKLNVISSQNKFETPTDLKTICD